MLVDVEFSLYHVTVAGVTNKWHEHYFTTAITIDWLLRRRQSPYYVFILYSYMAFMVINSSNVILDVYNGAVCNMRYPAETHLKLKSRKVSFAHNLFRTCPIGLVFRTEHGSDTAVLPKRLDKWNGCYGRRRFFLNCTAPPGPLATKRQDVLPQDLVKSRNGEIECYNAPITLKFDRHLGRRGACQISERLEKSTP